jgi:hypothetical protein
MNAKPHAKSTVAIQMEITSEIGKATGLIKTIHRNGAISIGTQDSVEDAQATPVHLTHKAALHPDGLAVSVSGKGADIIGRDLMKL